MLRQVKILVIYVFVIEEDNLANLDLHLFGDNNVVDIKYVTVSTFLTKIKLKDFSDYTAVVDNGDLRIEILNGVLFNDFQLNVKIKLVCLVLSIIVTLILRNNLNKLYTKTNVGNEYLKVVSFVSILTVVYLVNFIAIDKEKSVLLNGNLTQKPKINSITAVFDKSFMDST